MEDLSVEHFQGFWRTRPDAADYLAPAGRSEALRSLIADVLRDARILEIGCGPGRNLAHLYDAGYERVDGVEINPLAEVLLRETYPQLSERPVHVGAAEEILPQVDGPYDLIFSMAALGHVHADRIEGIVDEIARLTSDVLVIESSTVVLRESAAHDYLRLFCSRGFRLCSGLSMSSYPFLTGDTIADYGYYALRFRR